MKNRIKKLENEHERLNKSLILISSKSQKLLECRQYHEDVNFKWLILIACKRKPKIKRGRKNSTSRTYRKIYAR